jgi:tetratricopeptide (TPR) repeat protein
MMDDEGANKPKPEGSDALAILRRVAGRKAKELAGEAGRTAGSISDYERGKKEPSRKVLGRFAAEMELPGYFVDRVVGLIREARAAIAARRDPTDRLALARQTVEGLSTEGAAAAFGFVRETLGDLLTRAAGEEDRRRAREAWMFLALRPVWRQRELLAEVPEAKTWALCEVVCDASEKAAADDASKAVELAELSLWIAGEVTGGYDAQARSQGYALAFLGNARRVHGELKSADEAFLRFRKLWREESPGLFDPSRVLDLEASLRRAQRQLPKAFALLDRALALSPGPASTGRILLKRAKTLEETADYEAALATLREAEPFVLATADPVQVFALRFNILVNLCHLRRAAEAAPGVAEVRTLATHFANSLGQLRLRWLEGRIAAGLGRTEEAMAALMRVRGELAARGLGYDMALVSLELAELYAAEGRTGAVKTIARQMVSVFQDQGVHSEAKKALAFFRSAAEREVVTPTLARRLAEYLYRAKHDPELRFEAA